ncbi:MAG: hypothetical protein V7765_18110 [Oleispira sp.]
MKFKTLAIIAASSAMSLPAFAVDAADVNFTEFDTLFGTTVTNTATLSYTVGSGDNEQNFDDTSDPVEFNVDRKVIFSLTSNHSDTDPDPVISAGGSADTIYTLKNDSNAPISFKLPIPALGTTYTYDIDGPNTGADPVTVDSDTDANSANLTIALETGTTTANQGDTIAITVETEVSASAGDGSPISISFSVTAVEPVDDARIGAGENGDTPETVTKGANIVPVDNTVAWNEKVIQTVSASDLISGTGSTAIIIFSHEQSFKVASAVITLLKEVSIVSDPINGETNAKAIPGAIVKYTLTVVNKGTGSASNITVADVIPSELELATGDDVKYFVGASEVTAGTSTPENTPQLDIADKNDAKGKASKEFSFSKISVSPIDTSGPDPVDGTTVITFTVKLP